MESNPISERVRKRSVVPRVEGLPLETALIVLRNAGFVNWRHRYVEAYEPDGSVVRQSPKYGLLADVAAEIDLHVAKGSWLSYLPAVFRQSAAEGDGFLRNFLYVFQHLFAQVDNRVRSLHEVFDPHLTDEDFLPWLASWSGLVMAPEWDDLTRRRWVREAPRLYASRGTTSCLVELIRMFTDLKVDVDENRWPYDGMRVGVTGATIGVDTVAMPPVNRAHTFMVHVRKRYEDLTEQQILRLHQVIQMEKPAHTTYFVDFTREETEESMQPFMQIGSAAIGIGEAPEAAAEPAARRGTSE